MKAPAFAALALMMLTTSCDAAPQRSKNADTLRAGPGPGVKLIRPDSPAGARMPVIHTDTARQENMPVVRPPKNVQPK